MPRVRREPGDGIAVVAPSSPFDRERFERGVRALSSLGLVPQFSERVFEAREYLAGDDASREAELRGGPAGTGCTGRESPPPATTRAARRSCGRPSRGRRRRSCWRAAATGRCASPPAWT